MASMVRALMVPCAGASCSWAGGAGHRRHWGDAGLCQGAPAGRMVPMGWSSRAGQGGRWQGTWGQRRASTGRAPGRRGHTSLRGASGRPGTSEQPRLDPGCAKALKAERWVMRHRRGSAPPAPPGETRSRADRCPWMRTAVPYKGSRGDPKNSAACLGCQGSTGGTGAPASWTPPASGSRSGCVDAGRQLSRGGCPGPWLAAGMGSASLLSPRAVGRRCARAPRPCRGGWDLTLCRAPLQSPSSCCPHAGACEAGADPFAPCLADGPAGGSPRLPQRGDDRW